MSGINIVGEQIKHQTSPILVNVTLAAIIASASVGAIPQLDVDNPWAKGGHQSPIEFSFPSADVRRDPLAILKDFVSTISDEMEDLDPEAARVTASKEFRSTYGRY